MIPLGERNNNTDHLRTMKYEAAIQATYQSVWVEMDIA
jgi:hypothetical protein